MFYVGLDIHDKRIAICVLSETGQVVRRAQARTIDEMMRILEALPDRFEVCYEASCGYGHYHDLLCPIAARVTVAHPGRLRLIFRSRDKNAQGCRAAGQVALPGRGTGGARAGRRCPDLARDDHLPWPGDCQADASRARTGD